MRYQVFSPDGLPIAPRSFASMDAALRARDTWCERYAAQGGYYTADGRRIPLGELPERCAVGPVNGPTLPALWYDYSNQAWVRDGRYVRCGHPQPARFPCYACEHAGETAPPEHYIAEVV